MRTCECPMLVTESRNSCRHVTQASCPSHSKAMQRMAKLWFDRGRQIAACYTGTRNAKLHSFRAQSGKGDTCTSWLPPLPGRLRGRSELGTIESNAARRTSSKHVHMPNHVCTTNFIHAGITKGEPGSMECFGKASGGWVRGRLLRLSTAIVHDD